MYYALCICRCFFCILWVLVYMFFLQEFNFTLIWYKLCKHSIHNPTSLLLNFAWICLFFTLKWYFIFDFPRIVVFHTNLVFSLTNLLRFFFSKSYKNMKMCAFLTLQVAFTCNLFAVFWSIKKDNTSVISASGDAPSTPAVKVSLCNHGVLARCYLLYGCVQYKKVEKGKKYCPRAAVVRTAPTNLMW